MSDNGEVSSAVHRLLAADASPAADEACLAAVRLGDDAEAVAALGTLLDRNQPGALVELVRSFDELPVAAQQHAAEKAPQLAAAAQKCARRNEAEARIAAARFVESARHKSLLPTLASLLHTRDADVARAAMSALTGWIEDATSTEDRDALTHIVADALEDPRGVVASGRTAEEHLVAAAVELLGRGTRARPLADLIRRRGGASAARLNAPRTAGDVAACLSGAAAAKPILAEALRNAPTSVAVHFVRRAHLLSDARLAATVATLQDGPFWSTSRLTDLLGQLDSDVEDTLQPDDLPNLTTWVVSGATLDVEALLVQIDEAAGDHAELRHRIARRAATLSASRGIDLSPAWMDRFAGSADARLARFGARELARRSRGIEADGTGRTPSQRQQAERLLLARCCSSPAIRRACTPELTASFERVFRKLVRLEPTAKRPSGQASVRKVRAAGLALLKLLPDASRRLDRLASTGPVSSRMLALSLAEEAGVAVPQAILRCARSGDAKLRARASTLLAGVAGDKNLALLRTLLNDADDRVRANAVESLQNLGRLREADDLRRLLHARERLGRNRERANAIVALDANGLGDAERPLFDMLRDRRANHRLSGVWAVGETRRWRLLDEVARLARSDGDAGVRKLATKTVRRVATELRGRTKKTKPLQAAAASVVGFALVTSHASASDFDASRLEALRGGFGGNEASADAGPWLAAAVMVVSGGIAIGLIARKVRQALQRRSIGPAAMDRRLCKALGLPSNAARRLRHLATRADLPSAATLLLCPSLIKKLANRMGPQDRLVLDLALLRVAS
ncbi:MAG: HEAT repeat domain-containing protein [Planctomycetota bacterium]